MFLVKLLGQIGGFITTAITVLVIVAYTYGVSKVSAQMALDAHGNPIKEKALSVALGLDIPERDFSLLSLGGQCEVPVEGEGEEKENRFVKAFQNLIGERAEDKE